MKKINITSFNPPNRILMGPGPSLVHPRVLSAMAKPTIGHLDPEFIVMMEQLKQLLQYVFQTKNSHTLVISGPASAGMEMCFVNLVEPGDKIIVCENGIFGQRMKSMVERCRGIPILLNEPWGKSIDPQKIEDTLRKHSDVKIVSFVHAETSTGVL